MKTILKIVITIVIILTIPISIYYGLRVKNAQFVLEYINQSFVITLPNKVWFEVNGSMDTLDNEKIFENDTTDLTKTGIDFGLQYPKYEVITQNNTAKRTQIATRVGDKIEIQQDIEIYKENTKTYTTNIYYSQYGQFIDNTYMHEGCEVKISSENGEVSSNTENAMNQINYQVKDNKVEDKITLEISCK